MGRTADLISCREWLSQAKSRNVAQVSRRSSPVWTLFWKELHLQQLTFVVSILYVCGWAAILLTWHSAIMTIDQPFLILTVVHGWMIALLAGSLASAEERHLGTLDWQVLLPMSAARQWLVKCGVVFGVVVVLALALPALLAVIRPSIEPMRMNWAVRSHASCRRSGQPLRIVSLWQRPEGAANCGPGRVRHASRLRVV